MSYILGLDNAKDVYLMAHERIEHYHPALQKPYWDLLKRLRRAEDDTECMKIIAGYSEGISRLGFIAGLEEASKRMRKVIIGSRG